ncbi:MAG: dihydropteroate synthase [Deltaproteobacteria bacterium]|nr:MAG: dihydropteroate synthase [Deltaproteobacteria bacterium]
MKNKTFIMGVINITPDSFSDGGKYNCLEKGLKHAQKLIKEGADILDIGGESTRPFSKSVPLEEELKRVVPIVKEIRKITDIPISIDTNKAQVAKAALESGASIINDVSAMSFDPDMADIAKNFDVPIILMHISGTPENMQKNPVYKNLMEEIKDYFAQKINYAQEKGIKKEKIILDPGIGFGKTLEHNLDIINNLKGLKDAFGLPVLIGTSRKTFIRKILKKDDLPNDPDVITGSVASICAAILNGADIVRVHDVKETKAAVQIIDALKNLKTGD